MASLELDPASGRYRVRFRHDGQAYKRSLHTKSHRVALASLGQVEEVLRLLALGMTELPAEVDAGMFIVSGARVRKEQREQSSVRTLQDLFDTYQRELPTGAKEDRTLKGEQLHFGHFLRHLKPKTKLAAIKPATIQQYVQLRCKDRFRGKLISPDTVKKEITTLRLVWNWAKRQGHLSDPPPVDQVIYPKREEKPPFMTMAEIERLVAQGRVAKADQLWECLYLTRDEVGQLLAHVESHGTEPFVYPMFLLAAHTGMRRSELLRCLKSDFDFEQRTILVREKKRSRKHSLSYRRVPMSDLLGQVLPPYFAASVNSPFALCRPSQAEVSIDAAADHFDAALRESRWEPVRGFHVFRHSFASNAAAEGIDQRMIDEWMGHQTDEMRRRYRHLTPGHQRTAIDTMFKPVTPDRRAS